MAAKRTFGAPNVEKLPVHPSCAEAQDQVASAQGFCPEAHPASSGSAFGRTKQSARGWLATLARWQRQVQTRHALMGCSDRVLADIGIEREHIPLIAKGIDPAEHQFRGPALRRWWAAVRARVEGARAARRERRRLYQEIDAYSDRELEEIGLRRADIHVIARGRPVFRRAA